MAGQQTLARDLAYAGVADPAEAAHTKQHSHKLALTQSRIDTT